MGMSTHVQGFRPPDETWQKMRAIYDACDAAGIDLPWEVEDFFGGEAPDEAGVEVDLIRGSSPAVREWSDEYRKGYEVDVRLLPDRVHIVRFYNSW